MPIADPAATVILLRGSGQGFEVLLVERNSRGFFGSIVVFPGGGVEDSDVSPGSSTRDDDSHRNAAIRELAEETGIVLTSNGVRPAPIGKGVAFHDWAHREGLALAADELVLVSRWVTPVEAPRRFDTRFYLAACDDAPDVIIDSDELIGHMWLSPAAALELYDAGEMNLILPTLTHLRWLARRSTIEEAYVSAQGADGRTLIRPQQMEDGSWLPVHMPADD
ncbi:MAG: NUDIX hydrolase [Acidimicrobiia bacterium]